MSQPTLIQLANSAILGGMPRGSVYVLTVARAAPPHDLPEWLQSIVSDMFRQFRNAELPFAHYTVSPFTLDLIGPMEHRREILRFIRIYRHNPPPPPPPPPDVPSVGGSMLPVGVVEIDRLAQGIWNTPSPLRVRGLDSFFRQSQQRPWGGPPRFPPVQPWPNLNQIPLR